jgi:serine/threonine protein kinase
MATAGGYFGRVTADLRERLDRSLGARYAIGDLVGRGGMGAVFQATDLRHERLVAIKAFDATDAPPDARARFLREVRVTAGLVHPALIPVFDSGEGEGLLYYVMPLVRGETMRDLIQRGLDVSRGAQLLADVAEGLDMAHRNAVVHRDVKPENILIVDDRAVLTDFGVAFVTANTIGDLRTETGLIVGTPMYMSPEQLTSGRTIDGRSDVYALGCVLYEIALGHPPHASGAGLPQLIAQRATQPVELPATIPAYSPLRALLERALAVNPSKRFATAGELAGELRALTRETASPSGPRTADRRRVIRFGLIAATVVIASGAAIAFRYRRASDDASIAILPFANASGDKNLAYLSDGIADELLSAISDIEGIRALSRTSTSAFRVTGLDARSAAARLGVATLLEASVRGSGDSIRIAVRLIDGRTGTSRWGHTYDGSMRDLFGVQESIARAVAKELRVRLAAPNIQLVRARTTIPLVHDLVLRARYENQRQTREAHQSALTLADSAIALDSGFAGSWAARATVLGQIAVFGDSADAEMLRLARDAAFRAATLDSASAEAQTALALELFRYDWNWREAERRFQRALQLNPRRAPNQDVRFLRSMGRFEDARRQLRLAVELNPTTSRAMGAARISYFEKDFDRARRELMEATPEDRDSRTWIVWNAEVALGLGNYARAESLVTTPGRDDPGRSLDRIVLYARTNRAPAARAILDSLARSRGTSIVRLAAGWAALGEKQRALDLIDRAVAQHDAFVVDFKVDPLLDPLRSEPRFQAVMRKLNFPE